MINLSSEGNEELIDSCLFARRKETLDEVKAECEKLGAGDILVVAGDITSPKDLLAVRQAAVDGEFIAAAMRLL
jgi:methylmalonyl-CoA mutase cobalamin-binding subunit